MHNKNKRGSARLNFAKQNFGGFTPTPTLASLHSFFVGVVSKIMFKKNNRDSTQSNGAVKKMPKLVSGFTLVEMIVSIGLFTIVLFIATNAFLTIVNADRKSRSVRVATDNLNLALEDMSRRIKTGTTYFCGTPDAGGVGDCNPPADTFSFTGQDGITRVTYSYNANEKSIRREIGGVSMRVTSPEVFITSLKFIVQGSALAPGDKNQPYVVVVVDGTLSAGPSVSNTTFKIQTAVTQRAYDN